MMKLLRKLFKIPDVIYRLGSMTNVKGQRWIAAFVCNQINFATTSVTYSTRNWSDAIINISNYPAGTKAVIRVYWRNSTTGINYVQLFDQFGAAAVAGSELTADFTSVPNTFKLDKTATPFTLPAGLTSFMIQYKTNTGTITIGNIEVHLIYP